MKHRTPRLLFALLLFSSMWMPTQSCSGYRDANGAFVSMIPEGADTTQYAPARRQFVPIENADLATIDGWLDLWPYLWVIPVLAFAWWRPSSLIPDAVTLAFGPVVVWVLNFTIFGRIEYGAYVASGAIGGLWLLALFSVVTWWRSRRAASKSNEPTAARLH